MTYQVRVMGVPLDLGAGRRGVDMGPSALRIARLNTRIRDLDFDLSDVGDVPLRFKRRMMRVIIMRDILIRL